MGTRDTSGHTHWWRSVRWLRPFVALTLSVCAAAFLQGCRSGPARPEPPPILYGELRVLGELPDGVRTRVATIELTVEGADGKDEVRRLVPFACADSMRLEVGPKTIRVVPRDASGCPVYRATQHAEVLEGQVTEASITEWEKVGSVPPGKLILWGTLAALVIAVGLGLAKHASLVVLFLDHRWMRLPVALVGGFGLATVSTFFWQGMLWLQSDALPSIWMLLIPTAVAYGTLLEFRYKVLGLFALDSAAVAAVIGIATGIGCLGLPMLAGSDFPFLQWMGSGATATVSLQLFFADRT